MTIIQKIINQVFKEIEMIEKTQTVFLMKNQIMAYDWGTIDFIPRLTGCENATGQPQAELWLGAHKKAPSSIKSGESYLPLDQYINKTPEVLGDKIAAEYGELPFLFKVLSAAQPLSIQVHPDREQAMSGYRDEETRLLPLDAVIRNYKDTNHKPEMLLALTPFEALTGIRPYFEIGEIICLLRLDDRIEEFQSLIADLSEENIKEFMKWILGLKGRTRQKVRNNILRAAVLRRGCDHPAAQAIDWICRLDSFYPDDIGIFAPLLMNTVCLQPLEAIYMEPGTLHAYLQGSGLEIMANSDNVLRCGLTPKHVDIPELMKVASFRSAPPHYILPQVKGIEEIYRSPAPEFLLSRMTVNGSCRISEQNSAQIFLLIEGEISITPSKGEKLTLRKGESAFITATADACRISGKGSAVRAMVNGNKKN